MITFSQIKIRLEEALNDFGEALTAALAWIEEGENFEPAVGPKRAVVRRRAKIAVRAGQKPRPAQLA